MAIKWSILVATTSTRLSRFFVPLILDLEKQIEQCGAADSIEVLGFYDSKNMTIGEKRNVLLDSSRGEYISFIDDDDIVSPDYIGTILDKLNAHEGIDLVTFNLERQSVGTPDLLCKHSIDAAGDGFEDSDGAWVSHPNHIMVWRGVIAKKAIFPAKNWQEDYDWSRAVGKYVVEHLNINTILYWYRMQIELAQEKGIPWRYHGQPIES